MCSNGHLRYAICSCIYVTYGSCHRRPESRTAQPRTRTTASIRSSAQCRRTTGKGFWCFSSASVSLSATGPAPEAIGSRRRRQDRFYGETFASIGSTPTRFREPHRFVVKRNCESRSTCGFTAEKKAWLSGPHSTATRSSSSIASIVCSLKSLNKLTSFLCPRSVDRSAPST
jgi:hypothetical protein